MDEQLDLKQEKVDVIDLREPTQIETPVKYEGPSALLALAIQKDLDLDKLEQLMGMQERYEANQAKKLYVAAMAAFKENPPKIIKDLVAEFGAGTNKVKYKYSSIGNITGKITEGLSKHGFFTRWDHKQDDDYLYVTCINTHAGGHSEQTTLRAKPDQTGSKNPIQALGSANTYLEKMTLLAITGLATNEFDDDAKTRLEPITEQQVATLREWIETVNANEPKFLAFLKIDSLTKLPAKEFDKALNALKSKAKAA